MSSSHVLFYLFIYYGCLDGKGLDSIGNNEWTAFVNDFKLARGGAKSQCKRSDLDRLHYMINAAGATEQKKVVLDSNWRWTHKVGEAKDCYHGNAWDPTLCPDAATCAKNCALEGADEEYENTYGIRASGAELKLGFVTQARRSSSARNSSAQFSGARATLALITLAFVSRRVPTRRTSARARTCSTTTRRTSSSSSRTPSSPSTSTSRSCRAASTARAAPRTRAWSVPPLFS